VSDVIIGVGSLADLEFGVEGQNVNPYLGWVPQLADRNTGVGEQQPPTVLVISDYLGDAVRPPVKQVGA
jgi:hypothetical protein